MLKGPETRTRNLLEYESDSLTIRPQLQHSSAIKKNNEAQLLVYLKSICLYGLTGSSKVSSKDIG